MIRVLIADDHALLRRGVREILEESGANVLVSEAGSAAETLSAIRHENYDIALLDIAFPDGNGLDVLNMTGSSVKTTATAPAPYGNAPARGAMRMPVTSRGNFCRCSLAEGRHLIREPRRHRAKARQALDVHAPTG